MKISELFESVLKSSEYPKILEDDWAIAEYVHSVSSEKSDVSVEFVREMFRDCMAELRLMNVKDLKPGDPAHNIPDKNLEKQYLKMNPETMPPIIVENRTVMDGNHRFRVAKKLGMTQIWAYDIISTEEPF
jgi:hypothetical protein